MLVNQGRALVDYYIAVADVCGDGKIASNWIQQDVLRWLNDQQVDVGRYPVSPQALGELIGRVRGGAFETSRGREVLAVMVASGKSLADAIAAAGIEQVDESAVVELCRELLAGQSEDRGRSQGRQAEGPRRFDRSGEKEESQCQSQSRSGNLLAVDRASDCVGLPAMDIIMT